MLFFVHNKSILSNCLELCVNYVDQINCVFTESHFAFAQQTKMFIPLKNTNAKWGNMNQSFQEAEIFVGRTLKMRDVGFRS